MSSSEVSSVSMNPQVASSASFSKPRTYTFALVVIVGLGALVIGGVGSFSHFDQIYMAVSCGIGGVLLVALGGWNLLVDPLTEEDNQPLTRLQEQSDVSPPPYVVRQDQFIEAATEVRMEPFVTQDWISSFGNVSYLKMPDNLDEIFDAPCPFSGDESIRVRDTHMLGFMPASVDENSLALNSLDEQMRLPKNFVELDPWIKQDNHRMRGGRRSSAYYFLVTKANIPGTENLLGDERPALINDYERKGYFVPNVLEATVCMGMAHTRGYKLFGESGTRTSTTTRHARYPVFVSCKRGAQGIKVSHIGHHNTGFALVRRSQNKEMF